MVFADAALLVIRNLVPDATAETPSVESSAALNTFVSPDGSFQFDYPDSLQLSLRTRLESFWFRNTRGHCDTPSSLAFF
jgi:hypothetical protein